MSYLTIQYSMHENLLCMFFSNVVLEDIGEKTEDMCRIVAINSFVMGMPIRVTKNMVVETFDMPDRGLNSKHEGFPHRVMIPHDNAPDLPFQERILHMFISRPIGSKHTIVRAHRLLVFASFASQEQD